MIVLSCGQQKTNWQGTIEEVDGVTVVKNPIEPMYGEDALELDEDLSIGEAEGREEYMFSGLRQFTVDDNGQELLLDSISYTTEYVPQDSIYSSDGLVSTKHYQKFSGNTANNNWCLTQLTSENDSTLASPGESLSNCSGES